MCGSYDYQGLSNGLIAGHTQEQGMACKLRQIDSLRGISIDVNIGKIIYVARGDLNLN